MTENELNELFEQIRKGDSAPPTEAREARLRLAFRARFRRNRMSEFVMKIAASVAIAVALYFLLTGHGHGSREQAGKGDTYGASQFVVLPYGQSDVPLEHPVIVRVQVPESELSRLGISLPAMSKNTRVEADLLVGQDGIPRAVRVNKQF
jgi:hypothetical protein